ALVQEARGSITLVTPGPRVLSAKQRDALQKAFRREHITLKTAPALPKEPAPGLYLAAGHVQALQSQTDLLWQAWMRGLYDFPISDPVPGPGRGFFPAVSAPRGSREHCIALVGGAPDGLDKTVRAFARWLNRPRPVVRAAAPAEVKFSLHGKPGPAAP